MSTVAAAHQWEIGRTREHWLFEVFVDGVRAADAVAVTADGAAIVMRMGDAGYERDGLDRIKADLVRGHVELRRINPRHGHHRLDGMGRRCSARVEPLRLVICPSGDALTIRP